jgi:hypothetical protein
VELAEQLTDVLECNFEDGGFTDYQDTVTSRKDRSNESIRIRSLNYIMRKKEIDRIDRENNKMVDLIVNCKPGMQSARNMAEEYQAKKKTI